MMPLLILAGGFAILVLAVIGFAAAWWKERKHGDDLEVRAETAKARAVAAEAVAAKDRRLATMLGKALAEEQDDHAQTAAILRETEERLGRLFMHVALVEGPDMARSICEARRKVKASA